MKKLHLSIIVLCLASFALHGQFGVSTKYQMTSFKYPLNALDEASVDDTSLEFGLNYWFRLKNKRVEFLPEVVYSTQSDDGLLTGATISEFKRTYFGINIPTHIYPLDFEGDCNCPTFSKQGNLISKGFHWIINPGLLSHNVDAPLAGGDETWSESGLVFRIGIGIGLDIGITDLITVTPFAMYNRDFGVSYPTVTQDPNTFETVQGEAFKSDFNRVHLGLRLMFRPDYVKQNGGFRRR